MISKLLAGLNVLLALVLVLLLWLPGARQREALTGTVFYYMDVGALPIWVAEDMGYLDSVGVELSIVDVNRITEEIDMVGRGSMAAGFGVPWDAFALKAVSRPEVFRLVSTAESSVESPQTALLLAPGVEMSDLSEMGGLRIGFLQDTRHDFILKSHLAGLGVNPKSTRFIPLSLSEMGTAFEDNRCEVLIAVEPVRSKLRLNPDITLYEDGIIESLFPQPMPYSACFTSTANVDLRAKLLRALFKALRQSVKYIRENPEKAKAIAAKRLGAGEADITIPQFRFYDEIGLEEIEAYAQRLQEMEVMLYENPSFKSLLLTVH